MIGQIFHNASPLPTPGSEEWTRLTHRISRKKLSLAGTHRCRRAAAGMGAGIDRIVSFIRRIRGTNQGAVHPGAEHQSIGSPLIHGA